MLTLAAGDLVAMPATRLAALVRARELDPLDLIDAHLRRIEALDGTLGAFVSVRAAAAREEATVLAARSDLHTLPLAGLPVAIKDNVDIAGEPTRSGSRAVHRGVAAVDDELVRRLRTAGALVIGKTAMPELAVWPFTESAASAPTRNPWDTTRTCGGSSGGSAVAVATGMAALALGSDGGGSIRIPAACCGIVGFKPTPGLVPLAGGGAEHWYGCTAFGPLARTVADAALMLDVLSGDGAYRDPPAPASALRIGVSTKHPALGARRAREILSAVDHVADALSGTGHDVRREEPPYPATPLPFTMRWLPGIAQDAEGLDQRELESRTRGQARAGRWLQRRGLASPVGQSKPGARLQRWLEERDVLIAPVIAAPPVPIGSWEGKGWIRTMLGVSNWMGYTPPWNLAAVPALALQVDTTGAGLPVAVQLVAAPGRESLLLSLAAQLERLLPTLQWQPQTPTRQ